MSPPAGGRGGAHAAGLWIRPGLLIDPTAGVARGRALPGAAALRAGLPVVVEALELPARRSALLRPPWAAVADPVWARLDDGDVAGAAVRLAGLGPGLTPSGDDALTGILLLVRALEGVASEARLCELVAGLEVGAASRAMLGWAARGQSLCAVHDLLDAAARGDAEGAGAAAVAVAAVGASSGADLCLGMGYMGRSAIHTAVAT
jgi:hypothetical protein